MRTSTLAFLISIIVWPYAWAQSTGSPSRYVWDQSRMGDYKDTGEKMTQSNAASRSGRRGLKSTADGRWDWSDWDSVAVHADESVDGSRKERAKRQDRSSKEDASSTEVRGRGDR